MDDGAAMTAVISVDTLDLDTPEPAPADPPDGPDIAYLQYTSGSTWAPAGVMISHRNLVANFDQLMPDYLRRYGGMFPEGGALVSWLPFYHDMGLMLGVAAPILARTQADLMSPLAFLTHPPRWLQDHGPAPRWRCPADPTSPWISPPGAPPTRISRASTSSVIESIICGAERVQPPTVTRFLDLVRAVRFPAGGTHALLRPGRGDGVRGQWRHWDEMPEVVEFAVDELTEGRRYASPAAPCAGPLRQRRLPLLRIVDAETGRPCPDGTVGEIWTHGENVSAGYWRKPDQTGTGFGANSSTDLPIYRRRIGCAPGTADSSPRETCSSSGASRTC